MLAEVDHHISKEGSNALWKIGNDLFHQLHLSRGGRKVPQFPIIREKLYERRVPKVHLELGYQSKQDGEITVVKDATSAPVSRFPRSSYKRLYEIASVDVRTFFFKYRFFMAISINGGIIFFFKSIYITIHELN